MPGGAGSPRKLRRLETKDLGAAEHDDDDGDDDGGHSSAKSKGPSGSSAGTYEPGRRQSLRLGSPVLSNASRFGATSAAAQTTLDSHTGQDYLATSPSNGSAFDYPPSSQLKSRNSITSPVLGRARQRSPTGSTSAAAGVNASAAANSRADGFIGGAFARQSASGKTSLTLRRPSAAGLPRVRGSRISRLLLVGAASFLLWWIVTRNRVAPIRPRLTTKWWEHGTPEEIAMLLPKPVMPTKPPKPKPPAVTSHTTAQLQRLSSSFSSSSPPDWTAVIHLTSASQFPLLASLIPSTLRQSVAPHAIVVLAPQGLTPPISTHGPIVSLVSYPTSKPPVLALISTSSASLITDYLLLIDASLNMLPPSYAKTLLRAAGTKEYASAVLSAGGLVLPTSSLAPPTTCIPSSTPSDGSIELKETTPIHIPSTPSLLQTTWLSHVTNGLRTDIPLEAAIALGLWTKSGLPSFALPLPESTSSTSRPDFGCERLKRAIQTRERSLGQMFSRELGAGGGLRARRKAAAAMAGKTEDELRSEGWPRREGSIVLLLSGREELDIVHPLACGLSERADQDVRIYVADMATSDGKKHALDNQVFFLPDESAERGAQRCHLDLLPLGTGAAGESVSLLLVDELEKMGKVEVAIYVSDGERAREFDEVLKWQGAIFGPAKGGGERKTRARMEEEGGTVVISLAKHEIAYADWLSALPLEALRHWHTPRIDISVITNDRPRSLYRLLNSLQSALYYGDDVSLLVNLDQTADQTTQRLVDELAWSHGTVNLRHRVIRGGLLPAIVESWYPTSNDSYGVFLEDDVEVSPYFYGWLKFAILQYRYGSVELREQSARMFGVSLYQPRNIELRPEGRRAFDAHKLFESMSLSPTMPYLSQVPCSWGAAYFPEVWREFHSYLALRLSEVALPISEAIVPEIKSNRWPVSWKRYFIELVYMRGYVMLYPNYPNFVSLSTNHVEKGTHIKSDADLEKRQKLFEVPLMERNETLLNLPEGRLPTWDSMPILDLWGSIATDEEVIERGWQTLHQLATCPSVPRPDMKLTYNARELLCKRTYDRVERLVGARPLESSGGVAAAAVAAAAAAKIRPPGLVAHPDLMPVVADRGDVLYGGRYADGGIVEARRAAEAESEAEVDAAAGDDELQEGAVDDAVGFEEEAVAVDDADPERDMQAEDELDGQVDSLWEREQVAMRRRRIELGRGVLEDVEEQRDTGWK